MFGGPAKTAEPIEMLFRVWIRCTQGTMRQIDEVQIAPCKETIFRGKDIPRMPDDTLP